MDLRFVKWKHMQFFGQPGSGQRGPGMNLQPAPELLWNLSCFSTVLFLFTLGPFPALFAYMECRTLAVTVWPANKMGEQILPAHFGILNIPLPASAQYLPKTVGDPCRMGKFCGMCFALLYPNKWCASVGEENIPYSSLVFNKHRKCYYAVICYAKDSVQCDMSVIPSLWYIPASPLLAFRLNWKFRQSPAVECCHWSQRFACFWLTLCSAGMGAKAMEESQILRLGHWPAYEDVSNSEEQDWILS